MYDYFIKCSYFNLRLCISDKTPHSASLAEKAAFSIARAFPKDENMGYALRA
jgi:hypothetical protein